MDPACTGGSSVVSAGSARTAPAARPWNTSETGNARARPRPGRPGRDMMRSSNIRGGISNLLRGPERLAREPLLPDSTPRGGKGPAVSWLAGDGRPVGGPLAREGAAARGPARSRARTSRGTGRAVRARHVRAGGGAEPLTQHRLLGQAQQARVTSPLLVRDVRRTTASRGSRPGARGPTRSRDGPGPGRAERGRRLAGRRVAQVDHDVGGLDVVRQLLEARRAR